MPRTLVATGGSSTAPQEPTTAASTTVAGRRSSRRHTKVTTRIAGSRRTIAVRTNSAISAPAPDGFSKIVSRSSPRPPKMSGKTITAKKVPVATSIAVTNRSASVGERTAVVHFGNLDLHGLAHEPRLAVTGSRSYRPVIPSPDAWSHCPRSRPTDRRRARW